MTSASEHTLFTQHSRSWKTNRFVYPVVSRRSRGLSIGVNLNPDKACNFDCVYCSVDRTTPPAVRAVDLGEVRDELDRMLGLALSGRLFDSPPFDRTPAPLRRVNDVAFSGDGEPTSCPVFYEACELAAELIQRHGAGRGVKIVLITNATLLHRPRVREGLALLDRHNGEVWAKLDAGTEDYYRRVERTRVPFRRVLDNIRDAGRHGPIVVQSLFLTLDGRGPDDAEIDAYVTRLRELVSQGCRVKLVQAYTVARSTAEASVGPLDKHRLDAIAARVRDGLRLPVETSYGPS